MKAALLLVGALTACGATSSSGARIQTAATSTNGASASYRTFGFRAAGQPRAPFEVSARSFEVERRMRPLIETELARKGYSEQPSQANPDFLVAFAVGYAEETTPSVDEAAGDGLAAQTPIEKGRIAIDAFDTSSDAQVWHGSAEAVVDPKKIDDHLLQTAVEQVLAAFPAAAARQTPVGQGSTE